MATLDDLRGVYSTSELHQLCEQGRVLFNTAADRLFVVSAELNLLIRRIPGNPYLVGLDSRTAARRITSHLVRAGELQTAAARSMKDAWFSYQQHILQPVRSGQARTFNVKG